ncbi:MAG: regulatory protein RecX [Alcaligenaceae bacterium]|nr:regulatory protein RecX [Alcaligenaceae bacterium]
MKDCSMATQNDEIIETPNVSLSVESDTQAIKKQLFQKALMYLSRREYARAELRTKLLKVSTSDVLLDEVLDRLASLNYQSDERFVESFIRSKSHWGSKKILYTLSQYQLNSTLLESAKEQLQMGEFDRAFDVWYKKFKGISPQNYQDYTKQARFMASRGFDLSLINRVLKMTSEEISDKMNII